VEMKRRGECAVLTASYWVAVGAGITYTSVGQVIAQRIVTILRNELARRAEVGQRSE
jgi:hypothetical protein